MTAPGMIFVSGGQSDLISVFTGPFQFPSPSLARSLEETGWFYG